MRASTAYFAGAGTVIAAIVGGLGGGLLIADMVSPKSPKPELTRLEQRMSSQPIEAKAASSELAPNPAAPPSPANAAAPAAPAQTAATPAAPTQPPQAQVATTAPAATPAAAPPADAVAAKQPAAPAVQSEVPPSAQKQAATAPEDALAKARDVDIKRAATDKRRSERRQQWSEKRRYQRREDPDQELREVEAKVREATETRPIFASEPVRTEMPRIRLFDLD